MLAKISFKLLKPVIGLSTARMNACMHPMFLLLVINGLE